MANNLLSNFIDKGLQLLSPKYRETCGAAAVLQQMYDRANAAGGLVPGSYYGLYDSGTGNLKGISYVCAKCTQEYRMLSMFESFRQGLKCPVCKTDINVLKHVGAIDAEGKLKVTAQELEALLSRLPVRPASVGGSAPRAIDTWGDSNDSGVTWAGAAPLGSDGRWV